MKILKTIIINIYNTIKLFLTNLRRNFLRELVVGIGVIIGVSILIVATTFGDGFERLVRNSILGQIRHEQVKIHGKTNESGKTTRISMEHIKSLESIEGVVSVVPMADITYPISAIIKIPVVNRRTILGLVGNAIPAELADPYIEEDLRDKFPDGFHKTNSVTPVLFSIFIYQGMEDFIQAEGITGLDLQKLIRSGYKFKLRMGKSMFSVSSVKDEIMLEDGSKLDTEKIDNIINKIMQEQTYSPPSEEENQENNYNNISKANSHNIPTRISFNRQKNPYEVQDYKKLIEEDHIEDCVFVGFAPLHYTYTLSIPLEVAQAYKRSIEGDDFRKGYESAFIKIKDKKSLDTVLQKIQEFNSKNNLKIDEQYETLRGISQIVKNTVASLRALVIGLGGLILFLSAVAIFYSFTYIISRREKEIGLYRFFGSTRGKVIILLILESAFIGLLCSSIAYFFSLWLITDFLPSNFDAILDNLSEDILNLIFSTGSEFSKDIKFNDIFRFDYARSQLFLWLGVLISAIASLVPAVKGSYTSLFKTINN
ncbi:MAG: ABC transporter permease [Spirochaetota bacterium]